MTYYNKLVRDKVPELIESSGKVPFISTIEDEDYSDSIIALIRESADDFSESGEVNELLDIVEAVRSLVISMDMEWEDFISALEEKYNQKGGYEDGVLLKEVIG